MIPVAIVRHAPTDWNAAKRIQGRTDTPLGAAGRRVLAAWRLPAEMAHFSALSSPLSRAVETAAALCGGTPAIDERLTEMSWGAWEGRSLADLRQEMGEDMAAMEAQGLDFRPPGGESPRDLQARLAPLLAELAGAGVPRVLVTHKGVLRAAYAYATGWDMKDKPVDRLRDEAVHLFALGPGGILRTARLNLPLVAP